MAAIKLGFRTAHYIARRVTPSRINPEPFGRSAGRWRAMGALLHRMKKEGWVDFEISLTNQKEWSLTAAGRAFMENHERQQPAAIPDAQRITLP